MKVLKRIKAQLDDSSGGLRSIILVDIIEAKMAFKGPWKFTVQSIGTGHIFENVKPGNLSDMKFIFEDDNA